MFVEVLVCDGCEIANVGMSRSRLALEAKAKGRKWLEAGPRWYCPTCRVAYQELCETGDQEGTVKAGHQAGR
jgi:hypothetical protein